MSREGFSIHPTPGMGEPDGRRKTHTMRKALILAAFAALATGTAQALAYDDWDVQQATTESAATLSYGQNSSVTVSLVFTLESLPAGDTALLTVGASGGNAITASILGNDNDVKLKLTWNGGSWTRTSTNVADLADLLETGENQVAIVFDKGTSNELHIDWSINGTYFDGDVTELGSKFTGDASAFYNAAIDSATVGYDGRLNMIGAVASQDDIAIVPEPTALALMALGVAGLALRRRTA